MPGSVSLDAVESGVQVPVATAGYVSVGAHVSGTVITSATPLTPPAGATRIILSCSTKSLRWTKTPGDVGTAPTATVGHLLNADDPAIVINVGSDEVLKVIEVEATCLINYHWEKPRPVA